MDRHFILTHGRSGSNFLTSSLNAHPSLVNYGEALGEWTKSHRLFTLCRKTGMGWAEYLDALYYSDTLFYTAQTKYAISHLRAGRKLNYKRKSSVSSVGIKDFVFLIKKRGLTDYLRDRKNIKVIYLTRRNNLARYLSLVNMKETGIVKINKKPPVNARYSVDIEHLLMSIRQFEKEQNYGDKLMKNIPKERVRAIEYEDYFSNAESIQKTHAMLFSFLGVEDFTVASSQQKILSDDLREHIVNYAEVAVALERNGYDNYLV